MKVSVAMATYNGGRYLGAQLDSLVAQTSLPWELVVCDDGSSDDTCAILERFSNEAPFTVRLFRNTENLGYIRNFEQAIGHCRGDVVFLCDQDDVWFEGKIERVLQEFASCPELQVVQVDMEITDAALNPSGYTQIGNVLSSGHDLDTCMFGCGTAFRIAWRELVLPVPSDLVAHDNWIHRLALAVDARKVVHECQQYYRRHDLNASQWLCSQPAEVSQFDAFLAHRFSDPSRGWAMERERDRLTLERLERLDTLLGLSHLGSRREAARRRLEKRMQAFETRLALIGRGRLARLPGLFRFWQGGGYRYFSGWKSAIKDGLRPRSTRGCEPGDD